MILFNRGSGHNVWVSEAWYPDAGVVEGRPVPIIEKEEDENAYQDLVERLIIRSLANL